MSGLSANVNVADLPLMRRVEQALHIQVCHSLPFALQPGFQVQSMSVLRLGHVAFSAA